jgi:hypothetical protein
MQVGHPDNGSTPYHEHDTGLIIDEPDEDTAALKRSLRMYGSG